MNNYFYVLRRNIISLSIIGVFFCPSVCLSQINNSDISVWAAPSEQKIRPKDPVEKNNLIWSENNQVIKVAGAGNQHIYFQLVITVLLQAKNNSEDKYFVNSSNLVSDQGDTIPSDKINLYLEEYLLIYGKSSSVGETGYWPDALAPLKRPFDMQTQYSTVQNRPIWVDISLPTEKPRGIYKGYLIIKHNGKRIGKVNLEVKVYNFSLPQETHLVTYMNISKGRLAHFYNLPLFSKKIDKLTQTYYEFLYNHRMEPWFNDQLQPKVEIQKEKVSVSFNDKRYKYYMDSLNTKRVLLNSYPSAIRKQLNSPLFSKEFNKIMKSYLSQVSDYFYKNGWLETLVFNSPIDEPGSKRDFENTRKWASLVHQAAPKVPFLVTKTPVPPAQHPDWGTLRGYANNFSIHGNTLNDPAIKNIIKKEEEKGGELTWYISCDQTYPQPNYFIDAPALDPVMVPWITARYHLDGILYWSLNDWSETINPWFDAVTYHSGFLCSGGYVLNGEGSLLYPGDYTEKYTAQPNVYGPVSSIRFELLLEGIQDYEYIWMLKNMGAEYFANQIVKDMIVNVRTFSRNLGDIYLAREAMARKIEELLGKK